MIYALVPEHAAFSEGILFRERTDDRAEHLARIVAAHQSDLRGGGRRWLLFAVDPDLTRPSPSTRHVLSFRS